MRGLGNRTPFAFYQALRLAAMDQNAAPVRVKTPQLIVMVGPPTQGRTTYWPVTCTDECEELKMAKPISRHLAARFASDHINHAHRGIGALRVRKQKGASKR